jgi:hypothetical protein
MNYLYIINPIFDVLNYFVDKAQRIFVTSKDVYRVCTAEPLWYILNNGQFSNSSVMDIDDVDSCWIYDGIFLTKNAGANAKKLPFLSFEFKNGNNVVNMDDFIEGTKYRASEPPPLTVLMAAFCISTRKLHHWTYADFTVYSKMGDQMEFSGTLGKFPELK